MANRNEDLPSTFDSYFDQLMTAYLADRKPASKFTDETETFTTLEVMDAIRPMLPSEFITAELVYDYLVTEGYVPVNVAGDLVWLYK